MRYFVISDDGQKYGPADIATLNTWIVEGRLLPTQQLEDEGSGIRMAASAVQGLNFPVPTSQPYSSGSPYQSNYPRANMASGDDGSADVTKAWWFAVGGLLCCIFLHIWSFIYSGQAAAKGNPKANGPKIFSIVVLCIQVIWVVFNIIMYATGKKS